MDANIERLFTKSNILIDLTDKAIYYFRIQNFDSALRTTTNLINEFTMAVDLFLSNIAYFEEEFDNKFILELLNSLLKSQENKDYVFLADIFEIHLLPFLIKLQESIISKEEYIFNADYYNLSLNALEKVDSQLADYIRTLASPLDLLDRDYNIEYTSCGLMTLGINHNGIKYYMHSNNRVLFEAFMLANSWYSETKEDYIIYGLGLGYHVKALYEIDTSINIEVYESDIHIIQMACGFSDILNIVNKPNIKIIYDPDFTKLMGRISHTNHKTDFVIHYPSLRNIKNDENRIKLETYFMHYSSITNQSILLNGNFKSNIQNYDDIVDKLRDDFNNKDLYIIAAGPSLDKNFLHLKKIRDNAIILATSTVFRKLITAGITPNYVIVTDANPRVYGHIAGLEKSNIPMIFLSTAFRDFAKNYEGKKYMICQKDYKKAEEFADNRGFHLYRTGGSVSTTALDLGIRLGCRRIIFLGLDLAFTDNFVHASDTSKRELADTRDLIQVEDINGKMIYTSKSLDAYRKWIENRIKEEQSIEFIDATEGGAKIQGLKILRLEEVMK